MEDDDEFQMPLHDGSGEQLNGEKRQKKVRYSCKAEIQLIAPTFLT